MKKNKKVLMVLLATFLLFTTSCDLFQEDETESIAIEGTWTEDTYYGKIVISGSTYESYWSADSGVTHTMSHSGTISSFKNNELNAGSTTTDTDGYGYFVVLYDGGSGDGKYGVVRWKSLTTENGETTMSYCEGSDYPTNTYYDTADEAIAGMDDDFFTWYTTGMTLQ